MTEVDNLGRGANNSGVSHLGRITVNPQQCGGRLHSGHAHTCEDILDLLAAGVSESQILADFPYLEPEDIRAALEFAAGQSDHPILQSA